MAGPLGVRKFATLRPNRHYVVNVFLLILVVIALFTPMTNRPTLQSLLTPPDSESNSVPDSPLVSPVSAISVAPPPPHDDTLITQARHARHLPSCSRSKAGSFLMVFMGHSGSSAIMSELREHSQTFMEDAELVDHQPVFNSTAALEITRAFFERGAKVGKVPGFKIRPMHILNLPKEFAALARQYDTRIIWQYRKNVFKAAVGEYANRYLNDSLAVEGLRTNISMEERCKSGVCSFRIDNVTFLHKMMQSKMRSHHRILDAVNGISADSDCVREIPYEDYLHDRKAVMTDIQLFLGLRAEVTKPLRFKATKDRMCDVVENWDDVCRQLYGCLVWQPMLDDARNNCFCNFTTGPIRYCNIGL